jgi:phage terminase large subunit-like protein
MKSKPARKRTETKKRMLPKRQKKVRVRQPKATSDAPYKFLRGETPVCTIGDVKIEWLDLLKMIPGYDCFYGISANDFYFDTDAAQHVISFFCECLILTEGKVKPFIPEFWQAAILACLFGWKQIENGFRRYRKVFLYIPRKNGKTPLTAGIMIYVLLCDGEPGAGLVSAAATREQASVTFKHASAMCQQVASLKHATKVYKSYKSIQSREDEQSVFKVLSSEGGAAHGLNIHFGIVEELHAHSNTELVEAIESAQGSRDQPVVFYVTTADFMRDSLCNRKLRYSQQVRDRKIDDPTYLPVIYETPRVNPVTGTETDWRDPALWRAANPNLGVSVTLRFLEDECKEAQHDPFKENTFKRLYLNMQTESEARLFNMFEWDKCFVPSAEINLPTESLEALAEALVPHQRKIRRGKNVLMEWTPEQRRDLITPPYEWLINDTWEGKSTDKLLERWFKKPERRWIRDLVWYAGADFSSVKDITALVLFSPMKDPFGQYPVIPFLWFPSANAERRTIKDGHPYTDWLARRMLIGTEGTYIDPNAIVRAGIKIYENYGLTALAFDRWGSDTYYANWSMAGIECVRYGQGFGDMDGPINTLISTIGNGTLGHGGHPAMRWMAGNCCAEQNKDGKLRINKLKSTEKVDGILGLTMAIGLAAQRHPELDLFANQTVLKPAEDSHDEHSEDNDRRRGTDVPEHGDEDNVCGGKRPGRKRKLNPEKQPEISTDTGDADSDEDTGDFRSDLDSMFDSYNW